MNNTPVRPSGRSRCNWLITVSLIFFVGLFFSGSVLLCAQSPDLDLELPDQSVSRRASLYSRMHVHTKRTYAKLEGPGCIRHIWATHSDLTVPGSRNIIIRIFFDGEEIPYVEAPLSDFFGVMHGQIWYPIDTPYLAVLADGGNNSYLRMPFAKSARVEFEAGNETEMVYCMVDWHQYPGAEMKEQRRFCARWRRENPTQRDGENFLMLDADGPGQLLGFVYGLRPPTTRTVGVTVVRIISTSTERASIPATCAASAERIPSAPPRGAPCTHPAAVCTHPCRFTSNLTTGRRGLPSC